MTQRVKTVFVVALYLRHRVESPTVFTHSSDSFSAGTESHEPSQQPLLDRQ